METTLHHILGSDVVMIRQDQVGQHFLGSRSSLEAHQLAHDAAGPDVTQQVELAFEQRFVTADDKSVDVRLDRGTLTLDAQLATVPDGSWTPLHAEYRFGSYHREFRAT